MAKNGNGKHSGHAGTIEEWRQRRRLDVTLPSGMQITMRLVTLDELAADDGLPEDLVRVALISGQPGGIVQAIAKELEGVDSMSEELQKADTAAIGRAQKLSQDNLLLRDRLVMRAVVEPQLTLEDVLDLDGYDKDMIAGIASRRMGLDFDAAGRRIGAEPLSTFHVFASQHGCPPDCVSCEATRVEFSTVLA